MSSESTPLKLFISYSHKDKQHLAKFKTHLAMSQKNGIVEVWCDRELTGGAELDNEIQEKLLEADLIVFLVSSEFLASWYIYEKELLITLDRLENKECQIISVIVRPCDWKSSHLSPFLAVPEDGKPVTNYGQADTAWVQVVDAVKGAAKKFNEYKESKKGTVVAVSEFIKPALNSEVEKILNDTEIAYQSSDKEQVLLDDIFVFPDLKNMKQKLGQIENYENSEFLTKLDKLKKRVLILGSEQSGKTSLAKTLYKSYYDDDCLPLFSNGSNIGSTNIQDLLGSLVQEQYCDFTYDNYIKAEGRKILIIDDFDKVKLKDKYQRKFLENVIKAVDKLILISHTSLKYMEERFVELSNYSQYEICYFGHARRHRLIERWVNMGDSETKDPKEIESEIDNLTLNVNAILGKKWVPPKPFYVLSIIQTLSTNKRTDLYMTSHGHCYQLMIMAGLNKANVKQSEFEDFINYSTELAHYIFSSGGDSIDKDGFEDFQEKYTDKYLIDSHAKFINALMEAGIIKDVSGRIRFCYRYIFYFYVAKYLSDHLSDDICKDTIQHLSANLHTEKNANILIFLFHHSKDASITDQILQSGAEIYKGMIPATLGVEETRYLFKYMEEIPGLIVERINVAEERERRLEKLDKDEGVLQAQEIEEEEIEEEDSDGDSFYAEINRSVRLVEVIGQILRNRQGSLSIELLQSLALTAYSSGLKFLNFFLNATDKHQDSVIDFIERQLRKSEDDSLKKLDKKAENHFVMLCYGTAFSVILKIANSVGSKKMLPIFKKISSEFPDSPAHRMIENCYSSRIWEGNSKGIN
jgi:hypothetical protein